MIEHSKTRKNKIKQLHQIANTEQVNSYKQL